MTSRSDTYTHGHHDAVLRSHRWRTAENSAAYLLPLLRPGSRLLDVGCGPGTLTVDLARLVAPGEVVGIDVADAVVAEARRHALEAGVANVTFECGDLVPTTGPSLPASLVTFEPAPLSIGPRAQAVVQNFGVIEAITGEALNKHMAWFTEAAREVSAG